MSGKIKSHTLPVLFRLFVCQKLLIGLMIAGPVLTLSVEVKAQDHSTSEKGLSELIEYKSNGLNTDTTKIFDVVEQMPQFPGGMDSLLAHIARNIKYPSNESIQDIQGKVICRFIVNKDGSISNVEIIRSLDPLLDKAAIDVIKSLPNFIPGKQNGENVSVWYTIPINFKLR